MADVGRGPDERNEPHEATADEAALAVVARHALHDEELIAAFAVGGTDSEQDAARARSFIDRCSVCQELQADLVAIQAGVRADAQGVVPAPRDFRISVADAQRLGGTLTARGFLEQLRRSMASFGRPVGASLAALGIVGVLVGTVGLGSSTAGLAPQAVDSGAAVTGGPAPTSDLAAGNQPVDTSKASDRTAYGPMSTGVESLQEGDGQGPGRDVAGTQSSSNALLIAASLAAIVIGLALLLVTLRRPSQRVIPPEGP